MEQLQELIAMLGPDFLPCQSNKMGGKVRRLFNYLREADFPDEDIAAKKIGTTPGSSNFRKVKHYLKLALINGITAVKPVYKSMGEGETADTNALAWNYAAALGGSEGIARDFLVQELSTDVLAVAKEFETDDAYPTILSQALAHEAGKRAKSKVAVEEIAAAKEELVYACKVQFFRQFSTHSTFLNLTRASEEEKAALFTRAIKKLEAIDSVERNLTTFGLFYLKLKLHFVKREYEQVVLLGKAGLRQWIQDENGNDQSRVKNVLNIKLNMLRAYQFFLKSKEGLDLSLQTIENPNLNNINLYGFYEFGMIFALRGKKYETLNYLYNKVRASGEVNDLRQHFRETFLIIEAYIQVLIKLGRIEVDNKTKNQSRLRIGRFLNEMDFSYKEKSRRNIHVMIIKILYHSIYGKNEYFEQSDAVRKYIQRYLSDEKNVRAKSILLAMVLYLENGRNTRVISQKIDNYLKILRNNQYGSFQQDPYTEFLPYEETWNLLTSVSENYD